MRLNPSELLLWSSPVTEAVALYLAYIGNVGMALLLLLLTLCNILSVIAWRFV